MKTIHCIYYIFTLNLFQTKPDRLKQLKMLHRRRRAQQVRLKTESKIV